MYSKKTNPKIGIYIVFHQKVFEELYEKMEEEDKKCITLYGVNKKVDTSMNILYESELPLYNPLLQKNLWNEGSAFYHIYKNGLYQDLDYIGFGQYDMKLYKHTLPNIRKTLEKDRSPIFIMEFFPDIKHTGFLGCHNLIQMDLNDMESGLSTYNEMFHTHFTPQDVAQNRLIMCATFLISSSLFDKMMTWLVHYYKDDVNVNRHPFIGNAGQISEALIGMFLSLEILNGSSYYTFDVKHVWPLYKNKANQL
jgi:hypothetical protein